jgi:hypothetical protein
VTTPDTNTLPPAEAVYSPAQLAARANTARRRAAAMIGTWDVVSGVRLVAMTPRTYSRLIVLASPFLQRGASVTQRDVQNYVWAHHPAFTDDPVAGPRVRAEVVAQFDRHLIPPWWKWRYSRAGLHDFTAAAYALAASEIRELTEVAFADAPPQDLESGRAPVASLEAQFVDMLAGCYRQWPLETPIRDTPLRVLYQLIRCQKGIDFDPDESAVIAEELRQLNESAMAARN